MSNARMSGPKRLQRFIDERSPSLAEVALAAAAVFAALFLACTLWFWRRDSVRAAVALLVLFAFEAAVAPSLKHVMTVTKVADFTLGIAGIAMAVAVLVTRRRTRSSRAAAA